MRILIGTDTYHPDVNGASYFTQHLVDGLATRGHDVHVLCPAESARSVVLRRSNGVTLHRAASLRTPLHPTFRLSPPPVPLRAAAAALRRARPDVVHVQGHFLLGRELSRQARRRQLPLVATNHFMPENLLGYAPLPAMTRTALTRLAWRDFARVFNRADQITTPTGTACDLIAGLGLTAPITAISCGVDLQRFTPARTDGSRVPAWRGIPDRPTVLFVGRLDEEKCIHQLIDALVHVHTIVDAQLLLVGDGTRRAELAELATARGVGERVIFTGFVPDDELPAAYAACDVFANAGIAELQSLVTMEAMACGKPVVAADAMALPHLVRHGHNGFLFPPADAPTAGAHLVTLLTDGRLCSQMGAASRHAIHRHGLDESILAYEQLYQRTVAHRERVPEPSL